MDEAIEASEPCHADAQSTALHGRARVRFVLRGAAALFVEQGLIDAAAALTYYAVLSIFPAAIALVSVVTLLGQDPQLLRSFVEELLRELSHVVTPQTLTAVLAVIDAVLPTEGVGAGAGVGLVVAFFTASMYVRAFARFVNQIYGVKEGRTLVRFWSDMYLLTAVILVLAAAVLTLLVVSGPVAEAVGTLLGLDRAGIDMYAVAKWPVLVMLVVATLSLLYRFTPNVHSRSRRFPSQGAFIALATAACASVGFGVYVSNFAQYDAMYGTLTGAVLFLLWLWILNVAMLFGAVVDFEIERTRQLNRGLPAEDELQLVPRSTVAADRADERAAARVEAGRQVRAGISADHQE